MKWLLGCVGFLLFEQSTAQLFKPETFIDLVKMNHPLAKQAGLLVEKAEAGLMAAKGGFDPALKMDASRKTFNGTNYFYYTNPELVIPTPIGLDIKTGIENNGGLKLSSESSPDQSSYLGLEMPLVKGLLMDQRRASLKQARQYVGMSEQEKAAALNDLLFDAYQAYWQWTGNYQLYQLYNRYVQVAMDRFKLVRTAFFNGDRSAVDTIEALTQVQQFQVMQSNAQIKLVNAVLDLSNYIWNDTSSFYLLPASFVPDTLQFSANQQPLAAGQNMQELAQNNPLVKTYQYKLGILETERKLKFQSLLPAVNLKANMLNKGYQVFKGFDAALLQNNYKWGIDIKFPLFIREARGNYRNTQLKIRETSYDLALKKRSVETKVRGYLNEIDQLRTQLQLVKASLNNFQVLLRAEYQRFNNGESSLFLVNSRENKVIDYTEKTVELHLKFLKNRYAADWAAGILQ